MSSSISSRTDSAAAGHFNFQSFYRSCEPGETNLRSFVDLDDEDELRESLQAISSSGNRNFIVDFSDDNAWMGCDLSESTIAELVTAGGRPGEASTRWIDISYPYQQKALLASLGKHYDFSPRLLAMMCSEPLPRQKSSPSQNVPGSRTNSQGLKTSRGNQDDEAAEVASFSSTNAARVGNLYHLLDEVWHYTTVDQGRDYLCIGYNSIYPVTGHRTLDRVHHCNPLPNCVRVWTWLILCGDRTVITIHEDIFADRTDKPLPQEERLLQRTKQNLMNVFRSLSQAEDTAASTLALLPIRKRLSETGSSAAERSIEAPGLLFYFLFENWYNGYSLVTRRDSRYATELKNIRDDMFAKPQLGQIDRLDQVGSELGMLKRHYKSYIRIIDRIIDSHASTHREPLGTSQITARMGGEGSSDSMLAGMMTLLKVDPGPAARVRFERLKDMISLYALSEVKDYLEKKQSLVDMNFQLIAIRESRDVERLTRVSLLITKVTILFLPVSLMTAFYGTNFSNQDFTWQQYWITFAVVLFLSWVVLVGFGVASGTMEKWTILPPFRRALRAMQSRRGRIQ